MRLGHRQGQDDAEGATFISTLKKLSIIQPVGRQVADTLSTSMPILYF